MVSTFPFQIEGGVSMNARIRAISTVGVTLVVLAGLACNKWHRGGGGSQPTTLCTGCAAIHIYTIAAAGTTSPYAGDCEVDNESAVVRLGTSASPVRTVRFISSDGNPYVILFSGTTGSPVSNDRFAVSPSGAALVLGSSADPLSPGYYEYEVYSGDLGTYDPTNPCTFEDPGIKIRN